MIHLVEVRADLEAIESVCFKCQVDGEPEFQVPRVHYYSLISSLVNSHMFNYLQSSY